jgi:hypothetical protein
MRAATMRPSYAQKRKFGEAAADRPRPPPAFRSKFSGDAASGAGLASGPHPHLRRDSHSSTRSRISKRYQSADERPILRVYAEASLPLV